jgi:hypothetical protein
VYFTALHFFTKTLSVKYSGELGVTRGMLMKSKKLVILLNLNEELVYELRSFKSEKLNVMLDGWEHALTHMKSLIQSNEPKVRVSDITAGIEQCSGTLIPVA